MTVSSCCTKLELLKAIRRKVGHNAPWDLERKTRVQLIDHALKVGVLLDAEERHRLEKLLFTVGIVADPHVPLHELVQVAIDHGALQAPGRAA